VTPEPSIAPALREWHRIVANGDLAALPALLHPDVVFRSPVAFKPYRGAPTVALFGPSNPVKWGPWPQGYAQPQNPYRLRGTQRVANVILLQGAGDCVPCMEEGCERHVRSLSDCLQKLSSQEVIAAAQSLLEK